MEDRFEWKFRTRVVGHKILVGMKEKTMSYNDRIKTKDEIEEMICSCLAVDTTQIYYRVA